MMKYNCPGLFTSQGQPAPPSNSGSPIGKKMPMANLPYPAAKRKFENLLLLGKNDSIGSFYE
jgi:hypothetical protein